MPDGTNNIYVDASFYAPSDGSDDVTAELTLAEADVIGAYNITVDFETTIAGTTSTSNIVEYFMAAGYVSGTINRYIEIFVSSTTTSGYEVCLVDYSVGDTISGTRNTYIDCFLAGQPFQAGIPAVTSGYQFVYINYTAGQVFTGYGDRNIFTECWLWPPISGSDDVIINYTQPSPILAGINKIADVRFGSLTSMASGSISSDVDVTFAGWVNYPLDSDVFCGIANVKPIDSELTVVSGAVNAYDFETHSGAVVSGTLIYDLFCCLMDYTHMDSELTVIPGIVDKLDFDLWCGLFNREGFVFDVDLLSLKISNFQPAEDDYSYSKNGISVDITDDIYTVLTASGITCSGTCLKVDGTPVLTTFSGITDGYRMFYNPLGGFGDLDGSTEFLVRAENSNNNVLERSYYLTSGYLVDYENYDKINYGYENEVIVRMSAENMATCPKFSAQAYWFVTEHLKNRDLGASIVGVELPETSGERDLQATIYPQSTAYFYGKTFRVVLTCRDFLGNEMEPYEFEFKIEDPPN